LAEATFYVSNRNRHIFLIEILVIRESLNMAFLTGGIWKKEDFFLKSLFLNLVRRYNISNGNQ